jgi:hypothetical protein
VFADSGERLPGFRSGAVHRWGTRIHALNSQVIKTEGREVSFCEHCSQALRAPARDVRVGVREDDRGRAMDGMTTSV